MIGAFLNALGILLGALFGLARKTSLSARAQLHFKAALGFGAFFIGLALIWQNVNGTFWLGAKQLFSAALAIILGFWLGRILGLQKISNRLGRHAAGTIAAAQKNPPGSAANGFNATTLLFCAAPLGIVGAVVDGLSFFFYPLALKAVMDGLAMASFVKMFRWPVAFSAIPVLIFFDALAAACHFYAAPWLEKNHSLAPVQLVAGFLFCTMSLMIFEVRRVELANYLPALAVAPLLAHFF